MPQLTVCAYIWFKFGAVLIGSHCRSCLSLLLRIKTKLFGTGQRHFVGIHTIYDIALASSLELSEASAMWLKSEHRSGAYNEVREHRSAVFSAAGCWFLGVLHKILDAPSISSTMSLEALKTERR